MSSRAVLVPFGKYPYPQSDHYKILEDFFLKHLISWAKYIDHLYLIDSGGWNINQEKFNQLIPTTIFKFPNLNIHWDNLNACVPKVQENKVMIIDNDTVFYNPEVVNTIFQSLDNFDITSLLDNSGGMALDKQFSQLQPNQYRDTRQRFAPYLFACRNNLLKNIPLNFTPLQGTRWSDSMGPVTEELFKLNPRIMELEEDRSSLYFRKDGNHQASSNLDSPNFLWSEICPKNLGYYHIRNWNGGPYLVESRLYDYKTFQYQKSIMPQQEALRLLGWLWCMTSKQDTIYKQEIDKTVLECGITLSEWQNYLIEFKQFHFWIDGVMNE